MLRIDTCQVNMIHRALRRVAGRVLLLIEARRLEYEYHLTQRSPLHYLLLMELTSSCREK